MTLKIRVHERLNEAFNPKTVKIGDLTWMTEELSYDDGGIGVFQTPRGLYYSYNAAKRIAQNLGNGWRLPTPSEIESAAKSVGDTKGKYGPWLILNNLAKTLNFQYRGHFVERYYNPTSDTYGPVVNEIHNYTYISKIWTSKKASSTEQRIAEISASNCLKFPTFGTWDNGGISVYLVKD